MNKFMIMWVPVNPTGKVSDGCIKNLGFNLRQHQKTDWCLGLMIKNYCQDWMP